MTRSAIDVVALASALENFFGDRERHIVARICADFPGIEIGVSVQLSTGDCAFDRRAGRAMIGVEIAVCEGIQTRLHLHVEAAGGSEDDKNRQASYRGPGSPTLGHRTSKSGTPIQNHCRALLDWTGEGARPHTGPATRKFLEEMHSSSAPPRLSAGQDLRGNGAFPRRCTFCRTRTRSGRNDLSRQAQSVER